MQPAILTKLIADNPASLLIVCGVGLHVMGDPLGFLLLLGGIGAHFLWLL